jgi:hypothetical protein
METVVDFGYFFSPLYMCGYGLGVVDIIIIIKKVDKEGYEKLFI